MRWRKRDLDQEMDAELQFHLEALTEEKVARGAPPDEARRQALLELGGRESVKEELRDVHRTPFAAEAMTGLRTGVRFLRRSPTLALTIVATLGICIGGGAAVFSALDAILLRPLPFPSGDRLMALHEFRATRRNSHTNIAPVRLAEWARENQSFQAITGYYTEDVSETSGVLPEKLTRAWVAERFLEVWGVPPARGRDFNAEGHVAGAQGVALISHRLWTRRFARDPAAVGSRIEINGSPFTVAGVMPSTFLFPRRDVDVWSPVAIGEDLRRNRELTWFEGVGRLKAGVTLEKARADLEMVQGRLGEAYPATDAELSPTVQPLSEIVVAGMGDSLWLVSAAAAVLLLIACANIASLLLTRGIEHAREMSVRLSLGASPARIASQVLAETFAVAVLGAALGLGLAAAGVKVFRTMASDIPRADEVAVDARALLFLLGCLMAVTLLCGLLPALHGARRKVALIGSTRSQVAHRNPLQSFLIGAQVALAVTLLVSAGLLLRSFDQLSRVAHGFDPESVLTFHVSGSWAETSDWPALRERVRRIVETLRTIPGVEAASTAGSLPGLGWGIPLEFKLSGIATNPGQTIAADVRFVSEGYFDTVRTPLLEGEHCRDESNADVMVNSSFVAAYLEGQSPLGLTLDADASGLPRAAPIIGVVADSRDRGLSERPKPTVYWCTIASGPVPFYLLRTEGDPRALAVTVRRTVHEIDSSRAVFEAAPLARRLHDSSSRERLRAGLLTFFALTATLLAAVGLFGTLSHAVSERRREVGLRMALGAPAGQVVRHFVSKGMRVTVAGCACGLALAAISARGLSGMLFGVTALDPWTYAGVALAVLGVAGVSSLIPARRAARVDPMEALRED